MANVDTNTCNLFLGKILTKSSVHLTAFVLKRLITFCTSYISLSDVHLTATISLNTLHLFNIYVMWFFTILYINVIHIWSRNCLSSRFLVGFIWLNLQFSVKCLFVLFSFGHCLVWLSFFELPLVITPLIYVQTISEVHVFGQICHVNNIIQTIKQLYQTQQNHKTHLVNLKI